MGITFKRSDDFDDKAMVFLEAIPNIPKGLWGVPYTAKCPLCDGTITAERSSYNGHLHASCDKCGMILVE